MFLKLLLDHKIMMVQIQSDVDHSVKGKLNVR